MFLVIIADFAFEKVWGPQGASLGDRKKYQDIQKSVPDSMAVVLF